MQQGFSIEGYLTFDQHQSTHYVEQTDDAVLLELNQKD